ncbi:unnamed protein product, partial [marine sediment metagenome]
IINSLKIPIPSLKEQNKIVAILSSVDKVIEKAESLINKLKDLKNATMQELLTKGIGHTKFKDSPLGKIPEEWEILKMEDITHFMRNGFVGTASPYYTNNYGIPYLMSNNIRENEFDFTKLVFISKEFHIKQSNSILKTGDLLTVQSGHIGTSCVVTKDLEGSNCHALIISRLKTKKVNPYFLAFLINSHNTNGMISKIYVGSTIQHINVKHFIKYTIALPSIREQDKITNILTSIKYKINYQKKHLSKIINLKTALMQDL